MEHIVFIDRGLDYTNKVDLPEVWSRLGKAQLDGLRIKDPIGMLYHLCMDDIITPANLHLYKSVHKPHKLRVPLCL